MLLSAKVKWTDEESEALRQAVKECVTKRQANKNINVFWNLPWTEIAEKFPTKTRFMCRRHWLAYTFGTHLSYIYICVCVCLQCC